MPNLHSHSNTTTDPLRTARACVLNGTSIPAVVSTQLESIGIDVSELTTRLRQNLGLAA